MKKHTRSILIMLLPAMALISCNSGRKAKPTDTLTSAGDTITAFPADTTEVPTYGNWLLKPGLSAGKTRLNEDPEQVFKELGRPDGGDAAMGKAVAIWYNDHDSTAHSTAIYTTRDMGDAPKALVKQIRVTSPSFKTAESIGPSSSLHAIKQYFTVKETETYKDAGKTYTVYDSPQGIAFETDEQGECIAVIIHEKGASGQGTYLKFRTTNKYISR